MIEPKHTLYIDDNTLGNMWTQAIKDGANSWGQDTHGYANQHEWQLRCFAEAVAAKLAAPEGWQMVPIEPTEEMKRAGLAERHDDLAASIYRAMIAAAPQGEGK